MEGSLASQINEIGAVTQKRDIPEQEISRYARHDNNALPSAANELQILDLGLFYHATVPGTASAQDLEVCGLLPAWSSKTQ